MNLRLFVLLSLITVLWTGAAPAQSPARPFVAPVFTDHMVLQRGQADPVWGWAEPRETITVSLGNQTVKTVADADGKWFVRITPPPAGGPYELTVAGSRSVTFKDVLVGDVWLCSGQSNMEFGLKKIENPEAEIARADLPKLRLFTVAKATPLSPVETLRGVWEPCTPETVKKQGTWDGFSAVAYYFGRDLQENLNVPVGLIQASWGGTVAEAWTSREALVKLGPDFLPALAEAQQVEQAMKAGTYDQKKWLEEWNSRVGATPEASTAGFDASSWKTMRGLPRPWSSRDDPSLDGFLGAVIFRREIELPAGADGREAELALGVLDDADVTWINGVKVGASSGLSVRRYKVPAGVLKPGRNTMATWVLNTSGGGGITGKPENLVLTVAGLPPVSLAGDWQYKVLAPLDQLPPRLHAIAGDRNWPAALYNGMIAPVLPYGIKGTIWYQGESNAGRAEQYRRLLPALITDWRTRWGQGDFPFIMVQLAAFGGDPRWPFLREVQDYTARTMPDVGLATAIDIGDRTDIHPKNKKDVGLRLARVARARVYGEKIEFSGPAYRSFQTQGSELRVSFDHAAGLRTQDAASPRGFIIAGSDRVFYPATTRIEGDKIVLTSPSVTAPAAARYDWAPFPDGNVCNDTGLPAFPFRTDDWSGPLVLKK